MNSKNTKEPSKPLAYGWTTGACACAAAKAACQALFTGQFANPVQIRLPKGQMPEFELEVMETGEGWAQAGVIKDAGDDPDVTHGALIMCKLSHGEEGEGVTFVGGVGVGRITLPGLMLAVGEPAINPVPRRMIEAVIGEIASAHGASGDIKVEICVPGGEKIARKTLNARLGIIGGISILGTTGIVTPYSCSAWIHSIHRGIDVARASKLSHVAACVGSTSEKAARQVYGLPDMALIEMGNFVGGVLKYVRQNPVQRLTIVGGFAKMCKLAQGEMDLHSKRCRVDFGFLAQQLRVLGADEQSILHGAKANTALEVLQIAQAQNLKLADAVASHARGVCLNKLKGADVVLDVLICDREGAPIGRAP